MRFDYGNAWYFNLIGTIQRQFLSFLLAAGLNTIKGILFLLASMFHGRKVSTVCNPLRDFSFSPAFGGQKNADLQLQRLDRYPVAGWIAQGFAALVMLRPY